MQTASGEDVVETSAEAAALESPPLLVLEPVRAFLDAHGIGSGPLQWSRIGDGQSNVTYRIRRGSETVVLRRGPRPPLPKSTHDMVREARIQQLLRAEGMPVPEILAVCEDDSVLGVPFYVMSFIDGVVVTDTVPAYLSSPDQRRTTSLATVDTLIQLHQVDVTGGELVTFGRAEGYLARQVSRFAGLWEVHTTRVIPEVEQLADWLDSNMPDSPAATVVHGDFRVGNLMFAPEAPARVQAVLDWEMATIGDPLADLGYLTATYAEAGSAVTPLELTPVTREFGYLTRAQLVDHYRARMDVALDALPWYQTLALWKAAIFCEAIYARWLNGERPDDTTFGPSLEVGVPLLLDNAVSYTRLGDA